MAVPPNYPLLESPCNVFLPLHFTRTDVSAIYDEDDPIFQAWRAMKPELGEIGEDGAELIYGRCRGNEEEDDCWDDDNSSKDKSKIVTNELENPRVLVIYLSRHKLHQWMTLHQPVLDLIKKYLGEIPLPLRYYVRRQDIGFAATTAIPESGTNDLPIKFWGRISG